MSSCKTDGLWSQRFSEDDPMTKRAPAAISGIDHIVIVVADLGVGADAFRKLGFTLSPKGVHTDAMGSANHTIMLQHDYFELLTVISPTALNIRWRQSLEAGGGISGIALRTENPDAARAHWQRERLAPSDVFHFGRAVTRANGNQVEARFALVSIPDLSLTGVRIFACSHLTREAVWLPELMLHANTAQAILKVTFACLDPAATAAQWQRVISAVQTLSSTDGVVVAIGSHVLELIDPRIAQSKFGYDFDPTTSECRAIGIDFRVVDLNAARRALRTSELPFSETEGKISIGSGLACNVNIGFQMQPS
jgi:hypothetical protein